MRLFSTEAVSKYHPDKYADQISDAILTECLKQDRQSHCGIETMVKGNTVVLGGEITSKADINYDQIVRRAAKKLGYRADKIINLISEQSPEINRAVLSGEDIGAGDQGIMFGYATRETASRLPYAFDVANRIIAALEDDADNNPDTILKGDAKTQVTIDLDTGEIVTVVVSVCHKEGCDLDEVQHYVLALVGDECICDDWIINPAGTWTGGGAGGPVERSSVTSTADSAVSEAARFRERTRARSTVRRRIWHIKSPVTCLKNSTLNGARFRSAMPSV